jgi:type I restriction enzyme M protein
MRIPGLDNHAMGTIFEELIRRFNEENNEEAGEHFTPRDVVKLMANLIFLPIAEQIESTTYLVYDGACGTGGMLTVAEETLHRLAAEHGKDVSISLYGQESQPETYAISKADLLLKGEGAEAENFQHGSTLSQDAFRSRQFDFMLSNPPYGKSWKTDLERMGGKSGIKDARFVIDHAGDPEYSMVTGSDDGQLLFLVNMLSKMKQDTSLGSRIAEVHNGSSLFTGGAGSGESNVRRWIIENDWVEAIIALPLNIFYNTGIATYIWVLSNRKAQHRRGRIQLIDATAWSRSLRKNMGNKNCELSEEDVGRITEAFMACEDTENSKTFPRETFGYWKIRVRRPLRLRVDLSTGALERFGQLCQAAKDEPLPGLLHQVAEKIGAGPHLDFNVFTRRLEGEAEARGVKLTAKRLDLVRSGLTAQDDTAAQVIRKESKPKKDADPAREALYGRYVTASDGHAVVVEYEPDPAFKDSEQIPLLVDGGVDAFFRREVLPHLPGAWIDEGATRIGYEIVFARHFYKPEKSRALDEIKADLYVLEDESEGLLARIVGAK